MSGDCETAYPRQPARQSSISEGAARAREIEIVTRREHGLSKEGLGSRGHLQKGAMKKRAPKSTASEDSAAASSPLMSSTLESGEKSTSQATDETHIDGVQPRYTTLVQPERANGIGIGGGRDGSGSGINNEDSLNGSLQSHYSEQMDVEEEDEQEELPQYITPAKLPRGARTAKTSPQGQNFMTRRASVPPPKHETPAKWMRDIKPSTPDEWQMAEDWQKHIIPPPLSGGGSSCDRPGTPEESARTMVIPRTEYVAQGKGFRRHSVAGVGSPATETYNTPSPNVPSGDGRATSAMSKRRRGKSLELSSTARYSRHEAYYPPPSASTPGKIPSQGSGAGGEAAEFSSAVEVETDIWSWKQQQHSTPSKIWRGVMESTEIEDILEAATARELPRYKTPPSNRNYGRYGMGTFEGEEQRGTVVTAAAQGGIPAVYLPHPQSAVPLPNAVGNTTYRLSGQETPDNARGGVVGAPATYKKPAYVAPKLETVFSGLEVPTPRERSAQHVRPSSLPRRSAAVASPSNSSASSNADDDKGEELPGYITPLRLARREWAPNPDNNPKTTPGRFHAAATATADGDSSGDTPPPRYTSLVTSSALRNFRSVPSEKEMPPPKYVTPARFKTRSGMERSSGHGRGQERVKMVVEEAPRAPPGAPATVTLCHGCQQKLQQ
ncbi:unnamed protein product [Sphacelaria rigidula]